jgi:hypothetical protein
MIRFDSKSGDYSVSSCGYEQKKENETKGKYRGL